ncbi:GMP synthase [Candidatus Micrarchaeota archaeon CG1_02_49_24]|nr:MAG: GMP synthase [Candidatus Micrarchaeota archaeon CG1_02_49_24]HII54218.1 glutamine-hydrolyzing GMP synthase subunit GuaA [Candidatus Micrarchaeota archaeon]
MALDTKKFIDETLASIKKEVDGPAICAFSGGVDSTVTATLATRAISRNLHAIFVDTGLIRIGEKEYAEQLAEKLGINLTVADESERFLRALKGITDPEKKRKIIGKLFITVFEEHAKQIQAEYLFQGTIGPDWIESGGGMRDTIKSHHNVGGLPEKMGLKLIEPLRDLYKHEVRSVAKEMGIPESVYSRQPFPGPGLAVRVVGEVTKDKADIVKKACKIVEEEMEASAKAGKMEKPWQYFAALLPVKTVGVRGDERSYKYTLVVRAVGSLDGMTAHFSKADWETLERISSRITNEILEVGRVTYDITNKPPATIELE